MHTCELMEMAGLLAAESHGFAGQRFQLPRAGMQRYWTASKCRLQRWLRSLRSFSTPLRSPEAEPALWQLFQPLAEEVLASEVLTRVWAGIATVNDARHQICEAEPIARSVLVGHLEARYRVLHLLIEGQQRDVAEAIALNKLRRSCERWCDMLLAYLADETEVRYLAFDSPRVAQFTKEISSGRGGEASASEEQEVLTSIRSCLQNQLSPHCPNPDLNRRIAAGIMSCVRPDAWESIGLLKSLWLERLSNNTSDALGMIDELIELESPSRLALPGSSH